MTSLNEIRSTFLDYFEKNGHKKVPSSSLVPKNDPTLMFTNSGMVQFKNIFTGQETRDYSRAVTSQKCVRAGGKHNDLDNVGYTARHHTFFEMLGNFSFGDYFKEDAIPFAWNLITGEFGLPKDKLLVTVYHDDDEAANIWKKVAGLPDERIIRIATNDNFWMMGPTGPCGPSSEIFFDHGAHIPGGPPGSPDEDGDRFIEIWNLVFMQFEQFEDESREALPKPSIDTGMGLERIGAILQGKHDNYDTDLMRNLIEASAHATNVDPDGDLNVHHRVIADHLRSTSFLIADGVMPSNVGRGYVLRRIMRRAMRHAYLVGAQDPLMYRLVPVLAQNMGQAFPELIKSQSLIEETLKHEETRFRANLERGLRLLDDEVANMGSAKTLGGDAAFKLYDTYGFPLDLTQDALREKGLSVDIAGFEAAMAEQKAKARAAWTGSGESKESPIWFELSERLEPSEFLGYEQDEAEAVVAAIVVDGKEVKRLNAGETGTVIVNQTPFYAEAGGQVGDHGRLHWTGGEATVTDTQKAQSLILHSVRVDKGELLVQMPIGLEIDRERRKLVRSNHTATHLLNEALREHLGESIAQRGSLNDIDRLRFDFSYNSALSDVELSNISAEVNEYIRANAPVSTRVMTPDEARALGAQALFGEKYGEEVRVVSMGTKAGSGKGSQGDTYSLELCGGTHVERTGEIGAFVILSDSASSAGVRRIEALTGNAAQKHIEAQLAIVANLANTLKARPEDIHTRIEQLMQERRAANEEISALKRKLATGGSTGAFEVETIHGTQFFATTLEDVSGKELPSLIDDYKSKIGSGIVAIFTVNDGRVAIAVGVTDDLTSKFSAKSLVQSTTPLIGGKGGGGRDDFAQGGGSDASKIPLAVDEMKASL